MCRDATRGQWSRPWGRTTARRVPRKQHLKARALPPRKALGTDAPCRPRAEGPAGTHWMALSPKNQNHTLSQTLCEHLVSHTFKMLCSAQSWI